MATILDISLLNFLLPIFVFSLTFVFIYAILQKTELFGNAGKNQALNLIAAFSVAAISVFAGTITGIVSIVTPWIVFIIFILVMLFGMYRFFGIEDSKTWDNIGGPTLVFVIILIVIFNNLIQATLYIIEHNLYIIYLIISLLGAITYSSVISLEEKSLFK